MVLPPAGLGLGLLDDLDFGHCHQSTTTVISAFDYQSLSLRPLPPPTVKPDCLVRQDDLEKAVPLPDLDVFD